MTFPGGIASRRPSIWSIALVGVYAATAALAVWQATRHVSPAIFSDELELTQLSRSISSTGEAAIRGESRGLAPLAAYLTAPAWWLGDVQTAYSAAKIVGALLMAATVFPAYGLARLAVRPGWALFAAAGAGLAPALAYAPILVTEPTAYPASTLALFLIARWTARPRALSWLLAAAASMVGFWARTQLAVLFVVLALATLAAAWRTERMAAWRRSWTAWDWAGFVLLTAGTAIVLGAGIAHRSTSWYVATTVNQDRMLDYGLWAAGALAIGLGIVPVVAGLASVVRPRGETPLPGRRALATVIAAAAGTFGFYTAVKAAYLSTKFATLTLERNLIYLVPVLFAGTALVLERRRAALWAIAAAGGLALYLVTSTPYGLTTYPNYEAHGLAMAAFANRVLHWPDPTIERALVDATIVSTVLLVLLPLARRRSAAAIVAILACGTLAWTATAEIYAARGEALFSERLLQGVPQPATWVDAATKGASVVFLGQQIKDANPVNLLEFWNRSLVKVWSLDGTAPGPGPTLTPNLERPDGTLTSPGTAFVLVTAGVDADGAQQGPSVGGYRLLRLTDGRLRLRSAATGIYPDGWMGAQASYAKYDMAPGEHGVVHVSLSRQGWCGKDVRSTVVVRIGPVIADASGSPTIRTATAVRTGVIHSCQVLPIEIPTPAEPWLVVVSIDPTFSPRELDPNATDPRQLGAQVGFSYERSG